MMPDRVQLRRTRGWRMPPNTVKVCRPGKWGNPEIEEPFEPIKDRKKAVFTGTSTSTLEAACSGAVSRMFTASKTSFFLL